MSRGSHPDVAAAEAEGSGTTGSQSPVAVPGLLAGADELLRPAQVQVLVDAEVASQGRRRGACTYVSSCMMKNPVVVGPKCV